MTPAENLRQKLDALFDEAGVSRYVVIFSDPDAPYWNRSYRDSAWALGVMRLTTLEIEGNHIAPDDPLLDH